MVSVVILRSAAVEWLRYERKCELVCCERTPLDRDQCTPDVLGVTQARRAIEVEIKRSIADLRNNRKKHGVIHRGYSGVGPSKFYYLVPVELVEKAAAELLPTEGLLTLGRRSIHTGLPQIRVVKEAPVQKTKRLSLREVIRMVRHQTGTLATALVKLAKYELLEGHADDPGGVRNAGHQVEGMDSTGPQEVCTSGSPYP